MAKVAWRGKHANASCYAHRPSEITCQPAVVYGQRMQPDQTVTSVRPRCIIIVCAHIPRLPPAITAEVRAHNAAQRVQTHTCLNPKCRVQHAVVRIGRCPCMTCLPTYVHARTCAHMPSPGGPMYREGAATAACCIARY